ncbi:MAG: hypothetical protein ABIP74_04925 [Candidatus Saccharimonas sp.]
MRLPTKTIASLLVAASAAATVPGISQLSISGRRKVSQFDRLLQRHDRKGYLRAELLGLSVYEFRRLQKTIDLEAIIKQCGMGSKRNFRLALVGKLRDELLQRGWSRTRIETYLVRRTLRVA